MRAALRMRSVVAKETMSAIVKLASGAASAPLRWCGWRFACGSSFPRGTLWLCQLWWSSLGRLTSRASGVRSVIVKLSRIRCHRMWSSQADCGMPVDGVARSVVAKVRMSAIVKLAREIDESASDVVGYGMVSQPKTSSRSRAGWIRRHRGACLGVTHDALSCARRVKSLSWGRTWRRTCSDAGETTSAVVKLSMEFDESAPHVTVTTPWWPIHLTTEVSALSLHWRWSSFALWAPVEQVWFVSLFLSFSLSLFHSFSLSLCVGTHVDLTLLHSCTFISLVTDLFSLDQTSNAFALAQGYHKTGLHCHYFFISLFLSFSLFLSYPLSYSLLLSLTERVSLLLSLSLFLSLSLSLLLSYWE